MSRKAGELDPAGSLLLLALGTWMEAGPPPLPSTDRAAWDRAIAIASRHGLAPALYEALRRRPEKDGPTADAAEALRPLYLHAAYHGFKISRQLAEILAAVRRAEVQVVVLKGARLAEAAYRNVAVRSMRDIDLLVRPPDLEPATRVLEALGYDPGPLRPWYREHLNHYAFHRSEQDRPLELHWRLMLPDAPIGFELGGLWERTRAIALAGESCLGLGREDELIHLCAHAVHPGLFRSGLRSVLDLAVLLAVEGADLDWSAVGARAKAAGAHRAVALSLAVTQALLPARLPPGAVSLLGAAGLEPGLVAAGLELIWSYRGPVAVSPTLSTLLEVGPLGDRVRRALRQAKAGLALDRQRATDAERGPARAGARIAGKGWRLAKTFAADGARTWARLRRERAVRAWLFGGNSGPGPERGDG